MIRLFVILGTVGATLAACGTNPTDRALSGGALGAAAGATGAALTNGNAGTGALVGAGIGAAAGVLTDSNDINLGNPVWR